MIEVEEFSKMGVGQFVVRKSHAMSLEASLYNSQGGTSISRVKFRPVQHLAFVRGYGNVVGRFPV